MLVSDWQRWAEAKKALCNSCCSVLWVLPVVTGLASGVLMAR